MTMQNITITDSNPNYSYIHREDIQPAIKFGIDEFVQASYENVWEILQVANNDIEQYLKLYNKAFLNFQRQNSIVRKIRSLPTSSRQDIPDKGAVAINVKSYQNQKRATLEFIQILEMGKYFLNRFRTLITGQSIQTKITIQTSEGVYLIDQSELHNYITPILSTYGGSTQGNPFSLAYKIDIALLKEQNILNKQNKISDTNIFQEIWDLKLPYLIQVKGWADNNQTRRARVFNSKDAEIYDLMTQMELNQAGSTKNWLTLERYEDLRRSMGGGGGYRTSQLKSGDVGLIQDKMVTEKQNSVNIIRQQMIKESLEQLLIITKMSKNNSQIVKEELRKMFTEKEKNINIEDIITQKTNAEAQKIIESLFD